MVLNLQILSINCAIKFWQDINLALKRVCNVRHEFIGRSLFGSLFCEFQIIANSPGIRYLILYSAHTHTPTHPCHSFLRLGSTVEEEAQLVGPLETSFLTLLEGRSQSFKCFSSLTTMVGVGREGVKYTHTHTHMHACMCNSCAHLLMVTHNY